MIAVPRHFQGVTRRDPLPLLRHWPGLPLIKKTGSRHRSIKEEGPIAHLSSIHFTSWQPSGKREVSR